jgi:hypothetical protein
LAILHPGFVVGLVFSYVTSRRLFVATRNLHILLCGGWISRPTVMNKFPVVTRRNKYRQYVVQRRAGWDGPKYPSIIWIKRLCTRSCITVPVLAYAPRPCTCMHTVPPVPNFYVNPTT